MNTIQIRAFINHLKKNKNGTIQQKRELAVKTNNSFNNVGVIINPILLQQTNDGRKITIR